MFGTDINFEDPVAMSSADVKSLTYCELQCVNIKGLVEEIVQYPDFAEKFAEDIQHDLTFNLRDDIEGAEEVSRNPKLVKLAPSGCDKAVSNFSRFFPSFLPELHQNC